MPTSGQSKYSRPLWIALSLAILCSVILAATVIIGSTQAHSATTQHRTVPAQSVQVSVIEQNGRYLFSPATLTIAKGTQVTWVNQSDATHTVTSDTNTFNGTNTLDSQTSYSEVFGTAGTYAYHCNIHTYMMGTIVVTA